MGNATQMHVINRRYVLDKTLGHGGMGIVYQATDRLSGSPVALKMVTTPTEQLLFASFNDSTDLKVSLAQEFKVLATLRHPGIIGVLDYGFDTEDQPYFTMDLLPAPRTIIDAGKLLDVPGKVNLLIQILQALIYLHRREILHRDLKPNNVLVTESRVKVLDFGLSVSAKQATSKHETSGTLAYMAPEVTNGEAFGPPADLYAVGLMAYELLVGSYPFNVQNINTLVEQIRYMLPDFTPLSGQPELMAVLMRLLAKSPAERYAHAEEVVPALCNAINVPVPPETLAIRESFIQAASFVGREQEIQQLSESLEKTIKGSGGVILIGGESGVGKSRLLDELRIRAVVQGIPVLRGQGIAEGGIPYQVWRNVLRNFVLFTEMNPADASILKALVPDIAELLGTDVPDSPELEPQASRDRLLTVIDNLMLHQKQPLIFMLEDLQWVGAESLNVLSRLSSIVQQTPILMIGSYRDDESQDLPSKIPLAENIRLKRLDESSIANLSESMLGQTGQRPEIVEFLQSETEGNVFFLVEVVRMLAEEAGQLDRIGEVTLSHHVIVGGMKQVVQRRLDRLPPEDRYVLQFAAIIGRELDLPVLETLHPQFLFEHWLSDCATASVLEVQDNRWRFAHDKLREHLVNTTSEEEKRNLHRQVAQAIEKTYPDDPNQVAALAYHWEQAQVPEKAVIYLEKAGEQALNGSAYQTAIELLLRAIQIEPGASGTPQSMRYARRSRQLGDAYYNMGLLKESNKHLEDSLEYLGFPFPEQNAGVAVALSGQAVQQVLHRTWPSRFLSRQPQMPHLLDAMEAVRLLTGVHFIDGDLLRWLYVTILWLNVAEKGLRTPDVNHALSFVYAIMSTVTGTIPYPLHGAARQYQQLALKNMADAPEEIQAVVCNYVGIYTLGIGDWKLTEEVLTKSRAIYARMGHPRRWDELSIFNAFLNYYHGNFQRAYDLWAEHYPSSVRRSDTQMQYPSLIGRIQCLLRTKPDTDLDEAAQYMRDIDQFFFEPARQANTNNAERANYYAVLAALQLRQGQYQDAWANGEKTLRFTKLLFSEVKVLVQEPYDRLPELYITLWDMTRRPEYQNILSESQKAQLPTLARESCNLLKSYARVIAFTQPRARLWEGWCESLSGNSQKANQLWQQSVELAKKYDLPYDEGRAYYALGINTPHGDPQRQAYLDKASDIFKQRGIQDSLLA